MFEHPDVDVTSPIFAADGTIDGVSYETDRPRTHWINPEMQRVQQSVDRTFAGKTNLILGGSERQPGLSGLPRGRSGKLLVYDRRGRRMETLRALDGLQGTPSRRSARSATKAATALRSTAI